MTKTLSCFNDTRQRYKMITSSNTMTEHSTYTSIDKMSKCELVKQNEASLMSHIMETNEKNKKGDFGIRFPNENDCEKLRKSDRIYYDALIKLLKLTMNELKQQNIYQLIEHIIVFKHIFRQICYERLCVCRFHGDDH